MNFSESLLLAGIVGFFGLISTLYPDKVKKELVFHWKFIPYTKWLVLWLTINSYIVYSLLKLNNIPDPIHPILLEHISFLKIILSATFPAAIISFVMLSGNYALERYRSKQPK